MKGVAGADRVDHGDGDAGDLGAHVAGASDGAVAASGDDDQGRPALQHAADQAVDLLAPGSKTGRQKTQVKVGVGNGTKIQILEGLKQGDKVVLPS